MCEMKRRLSYHLNVKLCDEDFVIELYVPLIKNLPPALTYDTFCARTYNRAHTLVLAQPSDESVHSMAFKSTHTALGSGDC